MEPIVCPLCMRSGLKKIFQDHSITLNIDHETTVGGMIAYSCGEFGHVFLVRQFDVEMNSDNLLRAA